MRHEASELPRGVSWDKSHRGKKKYKTRVFFNGKDRFIGRFETIAAANRAYIQAMECFKASNTPDSPSFLQHVRELIHQSDAQECGENSPVVTPKAPGYNKGNVGDVHNDFAPAQKLLTSQRSLPTSQSNTQSSTSGAGVHGMQYELEAAAIADILSAPRATMAAAAVASAAMAAGGVTQRNFDALMGSALSDQQVEEAMAVEILQALGLVPAGNIPVPSQQQELMGQQSLPEGGACQLPGTAMQQGWIQSLTADCGGVGAAAPIDPAQQQQHKTQEGLQTPADLQQLLHTVLQEATQFDKAIAADLQCDVAMTSCCSEFLAATRDPTASAAAAAHTAQPTAQRTGETPKPNTPAVTPVTPQTPASESGVPSYPPAPLARQDSLLLKAHHGLDAVMYTAAVMRAVLDLYTALLRKFMEDDAAGDLVHWLSTFRHTQHTAAAADGAAPGSSKAQGAGSSMLRAAVINVMGKVVCALVSSPKDTKPNSSSHTAESTDSTNRRAGSDDLCPPGSTAAATAGIPGASAPLAQRSFTMAVLERLSGNLIKLHKALQQQQQCAIAPAVLWQQVHLWLQQLQAQAVSAEDMMAAELAALL